MLTIIPSKSYAHRAYICDFLAGGDGSCVICDLDSDDIRATRRCLDKLRNAYDSSCLDLDCGESGSTLRFMLPLAGVLGADVRFITRGRLSERPLGELEAELIRHGMTIRHLQGRSNDIRKTDKEDKADAAEDDIGEGNAIYEGTDIGIISASGTLSPGIYRLPGSVSSQYITGLLLALPYLNGDSRIELTSELQSSAYVDITIDVLKQYGINVGIVRRSDSGDKSLKCGSGNSVQENSCTDDHNGICGYVIPGGQEYRRETPYKVEGDWSQAAFWLAAGTIGKCPVSITGLNLDSVQGDRKMIDVLRSLGAHIETEKLPCEKNHEEDSSCHERPENEGSVSCKSEEAVITAFPSSLKGAVIDVSEIPDLAPAIACAAAAAEGETRLIHAERLRLKESDRIASIVECLNDVGIQAEGTDSEIIIHGSRAPQGGTVETAGDHRIVMMAAVLSLITKGNVTITGHKAVSKSYPAFFEELHGAGLDSRIILA